VCITVFIFFIGQRHRIDIITYEITGLEKLNQSGQWIFANHPTLIKMVILFSKIPAANCIVKDKVMA